MRRKVTEQRIGRTILIVAAACAGMPFTLARADAYPDKPLRLIVPFSPRGTSDVVARILADQLGATLGQTMVVDNRPGAGGTLGTDIAAKAPPDGYTMLYSAKSIAINDSLYGNLPYHVLRDFAPVTLVQQTPYLFVASGAVPVKSMQELIALARAKPGKLNYASGGTRVPSRAAAPRNNTRSA